MAFMYKKYHGNDEEDRVLVENFNMPDKGVFVDVGCGPDGIQGSNSYHFEKNGWKVLCVDAEPRNAIACKKNRKNFYSLAIASINGKAKLHQGETPDVSGLITEGETVDVDCVTLESLLVKENIGKIDVISIDTEGTEMDVWNSFDWKLHKPRMVIVEAVTSGIINPDLPEFFESIGYTWVATIGPNLFYELKERDNKTLVYGSSYDRGLEHLLNMWPDVRKAVPEAKLRVFYGWTLFDVGYANNPERMAWKQKINDLMKQDGIIHLGRISHGAVRKEFETAGIWVYPTHFGEISCITGMKAQAFGAIPVVIDYAALVETVQHGVKVTGDIYDQETKDAYKKELVSLLNDPERQEKIRTTMIPWAREKFGWNLVAEQWDKEFKSDMSLERRIAEEMDNNQPLKCWDLVKDLPDTEPLKERVFATVRHAFDPEVYKDYYTNHLTEHPLDEKFCTQVENVYPRFRWLVPKLQHIDTLIDLGCADGYLPLTSASKGITSTGVNLFKPSVDLANERAKKLGLKATFVCQDIFDTTGEYDAVVMFEVLEHLPDPQKGVDKAMSLLSKGGKAYFATPRTDHLGVEQHKAEVGRKSWDSGEISGHLRLFTEQEFRDLFKGYNITDYYLDAERCMCVQVEK